MRKLLLLFVGILFTFNIFAGEPITIEIFNKSEWTMVYEQSGIQIFYKKSEITKKNGIDSDFVIFKVINTNQESSNLSVTVDISFGTDGDFISNSENISLNILANDYVVDSSERGELKLRVPLFHNGDITNLPLHDIVLKEIVID